MIFVLNWPIKWIKVLSFHHFLSTFWTCDFQEYITRWFFTLMSEISWVAFSIETLSKKGTDRNTEFGISLLRDRRLRLSLRTTSMLLLLSFNLVCHSISNHTQKLEKFTRYINWQVLILSLMKEHLVKNYQETLKNSQIARLKNQTISTSFVRSLYFLLHRKLVKVFLTRDQSTLDQCKQVCYVWMDFERILHGMKMLLRKMLIRSSARLPHNVNKTLNTVVLLWVEM